MARKATGEQFDFDDAAASIVAEMEKLKGDFNSTIERAITVGRMLVDARTASPHGTFLKWVEDNCGFGRSTAYRLMSAYEHQNIIAEGVFDLDAAYLLSGDYELIGADAKTRKDVKKLRDASGDEPAIDEPPVGEPAIDEPAIDEPPVDEPAIDEPPVDEPAIDEPPVDLPEPDDVVDVPSTPAPEPDRSPLAGMFPSVAAFGVAFDGVGRSLNAIAKAIREIASTDAGVFLSKRIGRITADIAAARADLLACRPDKICPDCNGKGCAPAGGGGKTRCRGTGWTTAKEIYTGKD
jgi:hypothetical protein